MAILGSIIKKTVEIGSKRPKVKNHIKKQSAELKKLMKKAQFTAFGEHYHFTEILKEKNFTSAFSRTVPIHDYNSMFKNWWYRTLNGEPFVTWPDHIKYFALSSGTSEASSKHIPVTKDMLKAIRKVSVRQMMTMGELDLPKEFFQKGVLMIGGSTHLNYNGTYYEGDLSGITTGTIPFWFQFFYKPGPKISRHRNWTSKLEDITLNAKNWDIGIVCGVPSWIQILFEKIVKHYNVKTIHDIWPNLKIYVSGGVALTPYLPAFEKLTKHPLIYCDSYLASEGYIAYQAKLGAGNPLQLITDNGIYFEFVPFTEENFDADGNILPEAKALSLAEVENGKEYALLLSTCSGAWRYLIGDVIRFESVAEAEIIITGRTKHFLSLCGEHLSVDNMNKAMQLTCRDLGIEVNEFCVCGIKHQGMFAHHWFLAYNGQLDASAIKNKIDTYLAEVNDDYRVERISALKDVFVDVLPQDWFLEFLHRKGKVSAQTKFPRVLKGKLLDEWEKFLKEKGFTSSFSGVLEGV